MVIDSLKTNCQDKKILFYSSDKTKKMFSIKQFYRTDICILRDLGFKVKLSNSIPDFLLFWQYDFAFIYFYRYGLFPAIIAKLFKKKVIFTGGIDYLEKNYAGYKSYTIQKYFFLLCTFFSDKNILVSNSDRRNIRNFKSQLPETKFPLSFHVLNFEEFKFNDIKKKSKLFCTISWMTRQENVKRKGVDKSLYLFKKLHDLDNEFRMIIIGTKGEGTKLIEEIIIKENLDKLVTLTGSISEHDKIIILKKSSVYSQLSYYEGFGIAAIEALASGNIVIHTGKGGLMDGIGDNGILVEDEDYEKIALKIKKVLSDPEFHLKMINQGIKHVSENFRYEKRLADFRKIFSSLL